MATLNRKAIRRKVHRRIRKKIAGTAERPRLAVHFSNKNIYAQLSSDEIPRVIGGLGINILSTSRGLMTGHRARKENIGGELIASIW